MSVKLPRGSVLASLSLTPLIDVVFLLLIFFLVATRFAEEDRELDVQLPTASEARPMIATPKELFINIDQEGQYYVGGKILTLEEVEEILLRAVTNNPTNQSVIIRADKRVPFDYVVAAINACKRVGIDRPTVTTQGNQNG